jgi:hypothetical protein
MPPQDHAFGGGVKRAGALLAVPARLDGGRGAANI